MTKKKTLPFLKNAQNVTFPAKAYMKENEKHEELQLFSRNYFSNTFKLYIKKRLFLLYIRLFLNKYLVKIG